MLVRWVALATLLAALLFPLAVLSTRARQPAQAPQETSHPPLFYNEQAFLQAVRGAESVPQPKSPVLGGIIPHHLLAGHLIAGFFHGLASGDPPRTIILIGPNHQNAGRARALTSELPWETPFGLVEPDHQAIDSLVATGLVVIEDDVLTPEHSVAGIMPFIKYYLPATRVTPIILSGEITPLEAQRLGKALAAQWSDGTVVVASVDFSHYLIRSEAERRDVVTLEAVHRNDAPSLFALDNGYLDSPPSIATLMAAMTALGANDFVLLENTNSGALLGDELTPTTSYVLGYYRPAAFDDCPGGC